MAEINYMTTTCNGCGEYLNLQDETNANIKGVMAHAHCAKTFAKFEKSFPVHPSPTGRPCECRDSLDKKMDSGFMHTVFAEGDFLIERANGTLFWTTAQDFRFTDRKDSGA
jgi:hypothetical protein